MDKKYIQALLVLSGLMSAVLGGCVNSADFQTTYSTQLNGMTLNDAWREKTFLGAGGIGEVYKLPWNDAFKGQSVSHIAVKRANKLENEEHIEEEVTANELLAEADPHYLPKYFGCVQAKKGKMLFGEYLEKDFETFTQNKYTGKIVVGKFFGYFFQLPVLRRLQAYREMALGLAELHAINHAHNDIKPENIMAVSQDGEVRLIDFGFLAPTNKHKNGGSMFFLDKDKFIALLTHADSTQIGLANTDTWKVDIWALGMTIFQLENDLTPKLYFNDSLAPLERLLERIKIGRSTISSMFDAERNMVTNQQWQAARNLNICNADKSICISSILDAMMKIERSERTITASEIAERLKQIIDFHSQAQVARGGAQISMPSTQTTLGQGAAQSFNKII